MSNATIENTPAGPYLLQCVCGQTFELNSSNCLNQPMWIFTALCEGFNKEHKDCRDPSDCTLCDGDGRIEDSEGRAHCAAYELWEFSLLRSRRERQWQRLGHDWPWCINYEDTRCEIWWNGLTRIQGVYRWGQVDPNPTQRIMVLASLNRDRDRARARANRAAGFKQR